MRSYLWEKHVVYEPKKLWIGRRWKSSNTVGRQSNKWIIYENKISLKSRNRRNQETKKRMPIFDKLLQKSLFEEENGSGEIKN